MPCRVNSLRSKNFGVRTGGKYPLPRLRSRVVGLCCALSICLPLLLGESRGEGELPSLTEGLTGAASASVPSQDLVPARPGYVYAFPRDHGSHDDYGLEWWYFTGHLYDQSARRFGYEVTFFRKAIDDERVREHPSRWALRHLYFAHLALTDVEGAAFSFSEKLSRAAFGKAGADPGRMKVWIDRWVLEPVTEEHQQLRLTAHDAGLGVDLTLTSEQATRDPRPGRDQSQGRRPRPSVALLFTHASGDPGHCPGPGRTVRGHRDQLDGS